MTSIIVQTPHPASKLVLLFHGVGALPENMVPLAKAIADAHPQAAVVSIASPDLSDFGGGFQWFSVRDISEDNRAQRIAIAMPRFIVCVQDWQARMQVSAEATTLIGFSQGSIMALEATQQPIILANGVIGLSGRFAQPPRNRPWATVNLIHGDHDPVIASVHAENARDQIAGLGGSVTLDVISGLAHSINKEAVAHVLAHMAN